MFRASVWRRQCARIIRWRGAEYRVGAPQAIGVEEALATFNAVQRAGLRAANIDGYIRVPDTRVASR